jgi:archaellum component FlaC
MSDAQTWTVIGIFAAIFAGQFVELRSDRREFRFQFSRIDERFDRVDDRFHRIDDRFQQMDDRLSGIEVILGRIDERLKGVETRS